MAQPLVIRFATDVAGAKAGMAQLATSVASNMLTIGASVKTAADNINTLSTVLAALPNLLRTAAAGFAAFEAAKLVFQAIDYEIDAAKKRIEELLKVGQQAREAGVGSTFLQVWTEDAKKLNLEADDLVDALNRARRAATERIGEGDGTSGSDISRRIEQNVLAGNLGADASRRYGEAGGQEQRIRVVLDLVDELQRKGAQLAAFDLAGKMFGEKFESNLRSGVDMVEQLRQRLDRMDQGDVKVIAPEEVGRAEALSQRLDAIRDQMANALKPLYEDLARAGTAQYQGWVDIEEKIASVVIWAGRLYEQLRQIPDIFARIGSSGFVRDVTSFLDRVGLMGDPKAAGVTILDPSLPGYDAEAAGRSNAMAKLREGLGNRQAIAAAQRDSSAITNLFRPEQSKSLPSLGAGRSKAGGSPASEANDRIETFVSQLEKARDVAQAEVDNLGKTGVELAKAVALAKLYAAAREAGRQPTEDEIKQVERLAEETQKAKDKVQAYQQAQAKAQEATRFFGNQVVDVFDELIDGGGKFADVLRSIEKALAKAALQAALMGDGPLAGLFGTAGQNGQVGGLLSFLPKLFGGGSTDVVTKAPLSYGPTISGSFAMGGIMTNRGPVPLRAYAGGGVANSPQLALFGEGRTPEAYVPLPDGRRIPVSISMPSLPTIPGGPVRAGGINVAVNNYGGSQVTTEQAPDGSLVVNVDKMIDQSVAKSLTSGQGAAGKAAYALQKRSYLKG